MTIKIKTIDAPEAVTDLDLDITNDLKKYSDKGIQYVFIRCDDSDHDENQSSIFSNMHTSNFSFINMFTGIFHKDKRMAVLMTKALKNVISNDKELCNHVLSELIDKDMIMEEIKTRSFEMAREALGKIKEALEKEEHKED